MKKTTFFVFLIIIPILFSCNKRGEIHVMDSVSASESGIEQSIVENDRSSSLSPTENQKPEEKKIIKDGEMVITVKQLEKTKLRIDSLLKIYNGYYAQERLNNTDWSSSYLLKLRVPNSNFENLIRDIETGEGKIDHKAIEARDVTEQFVDLETRLENKRSYLERYKEILKQAKSIKEILEVEEIIRKMEEEIESATGRLRYLSDQVNYSSLDLTITTKRDFKYQPDKRDNFFERLKQSFSKGWFGFMDFLLIIIKIWPFWIIIGVVYYFWKKWKQSKINND